MSKLALLILVATYPSLVAAQAAVSADSVTLTVVIEGWKPAPPGEAPRDRHMPTNWPLAGAIVALRGGPDLGVTDESGRVTVRFAQADHVNLVFRAKDQKNLGCRVRLRGAVDSLSVVMMAEHRVAVWSQFGCKPVR